MVQKVVTHLDLANLENKITEQQTKIRHDQRNEFWEKLFIVDELKTESKVNNLIMVNMQKDIEEIKVMLKEIVKSLPTTYVSKEELIPIKEKTICNLIKELTDGTSDNYDSYKFDSLIKWIFSIL